MSHDQIDEERRAVTARLLTQVRDWAATVTEDDRTAEDALAASFSAFAAAGPTADYADRIGAAAFAAQTEFSDGKAAPAEIGAGFVVLLGIAGGYGDTSWGYRIARGHYLPFGLATVITAGGLGVVYLAAYYNARRFPLRRKQSLKYRAHPRHRKSES